jgi:UDP-N-acetylglucosamine transferase subunit ALG13
MTTLFVATAGGHLSQLVEVAERLPAEVTEHALWASNDHAQSRSLLKDKPTVFVPEVRERDLLGALRSVPVAHRLHREHRFDRVISTGSALAVGYLPYLAVRGVQAHYVESSARIDGPSLTGRILRTVPMIRLYTQYERLAHGRWHYAGWVFDRFVATKAAERVVVRRAVVTVGTTEEYTFRRLLDALAPILRPGGLLEQAQGAPVETLWQTGISPVDGLDIEARPWVPSEELDAAIAAADLVIGHAGTGSARSTLTSGHLPLLIPRDADRGEVSDAHQRLFAQELANRGIAMLREPETVTADDMLEAATYRVESVAHPEPFRLRWE